MITEKERKNREELFKLMQGNPELPVVAMVDGEIPGDDSGYWLGAWGCAELGEYWTGHERVHFRGDEDAEEICNTLNDRENYPWDTEDAYDNTDTDNLEEYRALPWTKAIIVYINLPD